MLVDVGSKVLHIISELTVKKDGHYYKPVFFVYSNLKAVQFCSEAGRNENNLNYYISTKAFSLNHHKKQSKITEDHNA